MSTHDETERQRKETGRGLADYLWEVFEPHAPVPDYEMHFLTLHPFGGGFIGPVRAIYSEHLVKYLRVGFGTKWSPDRDTFLIRCYVYEDKGQFYRLVAETELDPELVDAKGRSDIADLMPFLETVSDRLEEALR